MGKVDTLPREKGGLWLTKDNRLIAMHGNMTAVTYKIINFVLLLAQKEGRPHNLKVTGAELVKVCNIKIVKGITFYNDS